MVTLFSCICQKDKSVKPPPMLFPGNLQLFDTSFSKEQQ